MNKKTLARIAFLTAAVFVGLYLYACKTDDVVQFYEAGNQTIQTPGCGFYVQIKSDRKDKIERYEEETKIFLLTLDLYECRSSEIPQYRLKELEEFLEEARTRNVTCIFRAAYGFEKETSNDADSLERIEAHVCQIAPILNEYKDRIICVQAGMFGPWGEWHSSRYLKGEQAQQNRCWLTKLWLDHLDSEMVVALRRPSFIKEAVEVGLPIERIGYHNDGLLGSSTDLGTYEDEMDRREALQWLQENLITGHNGGEMPCVSDYSQVEQVLKEFPQMKISYLNMKYNEAVYEDWKTQKIGTENAYDYIAKRLGSRLYISSLKYPEKMAYKFLLWNRKIVVTLENEGFAPLSGKYNLEWVIEDHQGTLHTFETDVLVNGLDHQESLAIELSIWNLLSIDVKRIGIRIYDNSNPIKDNEHCVEFANDLFEYCDGVNYFLQASQLL